MVTVVCLAVVLPFATFVLAQAGNSSDTTMAVEKKYTVQFLHMIPFTGLDPQKGEACQLSSQLVADIINKRRDILSDYHIQMRYEDDSIGRWAVRRVVEFDRDFDNETRLVKSPIVIGPQYSTGCKSMAPILPHVYSVAITTYCTAPVLAEHSRFPNFYLSLATQKTTAFAILKFIQQVGHWKRFAIITNVNNPNDYGMALFLHQNAIRLGYNIPWFDMVSDVEESTMVSLKQSDVRVLVIAIAHDFLMYKVFCEAYKKGMRGSRYVFTADVSVLTDPNELKDEIYDGCTKQMIIEQLKQTILIGITLYPTEKDRDRKCQLGYTWPKFEEMMRNITHSQPPADYMTRYMCHDVTLKALMSLDMAERKLNRMNLTLHDMHERPEIVMKMTNESVFKENVAVLRTGNMTYNERGQIENDVQVIAQWTHEEGVVNVATVQQRLNSTKDFELESFELRFVQSIKNDWQPPNDQPQLLIIRKKVPHGLFAAIVVLAVLLAIWQFTCIGFAFGTIIKGLEYGRTFAVSKLFGCCGCLLLDVAAAFFVVPDMENASSTAGVIFLVIGTSIVHSILTGRAIAPVQYIKRSQSPLASGSIAVSQRTVVRKQPKTNTLTAARTISKGNRGEMVEHSIQGSGSVIVRDAVRRSHSCRSVPTMAEISREVWKKLDVFAAEGAAGFFLVNVVALICWLATDPIRCLEEKRDAPSYNEEADTVIESSFINCSSAKWMTPWVLSVVFVHGLVLFVGVFSGYQLAHVCANCSEVAFIRIGVANALTLLIAALLIAVILHNPVGQRIAISVVLITMSGLTTMTWFYPTMFFWC